MYKYGIISTASITKRFVDGLRLANDNVICIASRDINKAKDFADNNAINKYYGSYEEVYEDKDVDVVYIPVVNSLHYECAKKALLHKKHVVLEKPFTTRETEAIELSKIAKANNCFLFEGVKNVFVPSTLFIKKYLNEIGEITRIETLQGTKKPFPIEHWMHDINYGGGAFNGSFAYVFHYLRYLFNKEISNLDGTYIPSRNTDLICNLSFDIGNIKVKSTIDMSKDLDNTCIIYGNKTKIIIYEFWRSHHVIIEKNGLIIDEFKDEGNEFVYEAKHIQDCLNKGMIESPIIKVEDSIKEAKNIETLYRKWNYIKS